MTEAVDAPPARTRPRWPGRAALALGVLTPVAVAVGVGAVTLDAFEVATVVAWAGIASSILAIVGGFVAIAGNWDRGAGIGAVALGVLANPLVLTHGLGAVGSA